MPILDLLMVSYAQDKIPTPNTLQLGCSYHLHSIHHFLPTWGAVRLVIREEHSGTLVLTNYLDANVDRKLGKSSIIRRAKC